MLFCDFTLLLQCFEIIIYPSFNLLGSVSFRLLVGIIIQYHLDFFFVVFYIQNHSGPTFSAGRITMLLSFISVVRALLSILARLEVGCFDTSRHLWTQHLNKVPLPGFDLSKCLTSDFVLAIISSVGIFLGVTKKLRPL